MRLVDIFRKWTATVLQSLSGKSFKDIDEETFFYLAKPWTMCLDIDFTWKRKQLEKQLCANSWTTVCYLTYHKRFERKRTAKSVTRNSGQKSMWTQMFERVENWEDICVLCGCSFKKDFIRETIS